MKKRMRKIPCGILIFKLQTFITIQHGGYRVLDATCVTSNELSNETSRTNMSMEIIRHCQIELWQCQIRMVRVYLLKRCCLNTFKYIDDFCKKKKSPRY